MNKDNNNFHLTKEQLEEFKKERNKVNNDALKSFGLLYGSAILLHIGPVISSLLGVANKSLAVFFTTLSIASVVPLGVGYVKSIKKCAKAFYYNMNYHEMKKNFEENEMNTKSK